MQTNFETGWKKFWIFICWFRSHSKYLCYGTLLDFHPMNPDSRALHRRQTKYVCRNRRHGIGTYDHHTELDPVVAIYLKEFQNKDERKKTNENQIMNTPLVAYSLNNSKMNLWNVANMNSKFVHFFSIRVNAQKMLK